MNAYRLPDGRILVPMRAESEGIVGDAWVPVDADSDEAKGWLAYYERLGEEMPDAPEEEADATD